MKLQKTILASSLLLASGLAMADSDWIVRAGFSTITPKSNNNPVVSVDNSSSFSFTIEKMLGPKLGLEVLAAYPFEHDIRLVGGNKVGTATHLPPTVSLNWHMLPDSTFSPYIGAGVNYTIFWDESTTGALAGSKLTLDDSFGLAAQVGFDINLSNNWLLNGSVRYISISTKATLNGASLGSVDIDPVVYSFNVGKRF